MDGFVWLDIRHVYQEQDKSADTLSKEALNLSPRILCFSESLDGSISIRVNLRSFRAFCSGA